MRLSAAAVVIAACLAANCRNIDVVTESYASVGEARQAGALDRGWIPKGIPESAVDLRVAHDLDANRRWGLFSFQAAEADRLRAMVDAEQSLRGVVCDIPGRVEWWPVMLRGAIDPEQVKATGLTAYRTRQDNLIVVVNWNQGRAYYWSNP
jgi:hypothetical protein